MGFGTNGIGPIRNGKSDLIRKALLQNRKTPCPISAMQDNLKMDAKNILKKSLDVIIFSGRNDFVNNFTEQHREGFRSFMCFLNNNNFNEYVDGILVLNQKMPSGPVYFTDIIAVNLPELLNMKDNVDLYILKIKLSKNLEEKRKRYPLFFSHKELSVLAKLKYYMRLDELGRYAPGIKPTVKPADDKKEGELDLGPLL
jgi:hypothetical protein